jgi:hypothetical protein
MFKADLGGVFHLLIAGAKSGSKAGSGHGAGGADLP